FISFTFFLDTISQVKSTVTKLLTKGMRINISCSCPRLLSDRDNGRGRVSIQYLGSNEVTILINYYLNMSILFNVCFRPRNIAAHQLYMRISFVKLCHPTHSDFSSASTFRKLSPTTNSLAFISRIKRRISQSSGFGNSTIPFFITVCQKRL